MCNSVTYQMRKQIKQGKTHCYILYKMLENIIWQDITPLVGMPSSLVRYLRMLLVWIYIQRPAKF